MDKDKLREVGMKIKALLDDYGVQADAIELSIIVPEAYFREIAPGFPEHKPHQMNVGVSRDNWVISLLTTAKR